MSNGNEALIGAREGTTTDRKTILITLIKPPLNKALKALSSSKTGETFRFRFRVSHQDLGPLQVSGSVRRSEDGKLSVVLVINAKNDQTQNWISENRDSIASSLLSSLRQGEEFRGIRVEQLNVMTIQELTRPPKPTEAVQRGRTNVPRTRVERPTYRPPPRPTVIEPGREAPPFEGDISSQIAPQMGFKVRTPRRPDQYSKYEYSASENGLRDTLGRLALETILREGEEAQYQRRAVIESLKAIRIEESSIGYNGNLYDLITKGRLTEDKAAIFYYIMNGQPPESLEQAFKYASIYRNYLQGKTDNPPESAGGLASQINQMLDENSEYIKGLKQRLRMAVEVVSYDAEANLYVLKLRRGKREIYLGVHVNTRAGTWELVAVDGSEKGVKEKLASFYTVGGGVEFRWQTSEGDVRPFFIMDVDFYKQFLRNADIVEHGGGAQGLGIRTEAQAGVDIRVSERVGAAVIVFGSIERALVPKSSAFLLTGDNRIARVDWEPEIRSRLGIAVEGSIDVARATELFFTLTGVRYEVRRREDGSVSYRIYPGVGVRWRPGEGRYVLQASIMALMSSAREVEGATARIDFTNPRTGEGIAAEATFTESGTRYYVWLKIPLEKLWEYIEDAWDWLFGEEESPSEEEGEEEPQAIEVVARPASPQQQPEETEEETR